MWEDLEWNPGLVPPLKLGLHIGQIVFGFVIFCLEIAVFRAEGASIVGQNGWTFGVCFLSIPAWIYLCMAPRFPRTRKLANPYVMAVIDGLYTIFWLSAFSTQAAYNTANLCGHACGPSKAIVGLGFLTFLLFTGTTFISLYTVQYYKWNNSLPGYDDKQPRAHNIDPDKAAFSMGPVDEEAYAPVGMNDHDGGHPGSSHLDDHDYDSPFAGGSQAGGYSDHGSYGRQGARMTPENPFQQDNPFDTDSEYHSQVHQADGGRIYAPPSVNDDYDDERPAHFPAANYDRVAR